MKKLEGLIRSFTGGHRRRGRRRGEEDDDDVEAIAAAEQRIFRYDALVAATGNFDLKNKLGSGGVGTVFRGRLEDGREVAVKRLEGGGRRRHDGAGEKEFASVAAALSRVQHRNVVNLYGYCGGAGAGEKLLVYEYVPNGSLDKLLFDDRRRPELDWRRRYEVAMGVARGLLYLHEDAQSAPVVHRNIKAGNVLLDGRWAAKIADAGMGSLFPEDLTHVVGAGVGASGYMAPEFLMHGFLSPKADVFSFGVLLLELVSGRSSCLRPPAVAQGLLEWAWKLFRKGQALEVLDPEIRSAASEEQVSLCVHVALLCVQSDPKQRPDMSRVVVILSKKPAAALEEPMRPGLLGSRYRKRGGSSSASRKEHRLYQTISTESSPYSSASSSSTISAAIAFASSSNAGGNVPATI